MYCTIIHVLSLTEQVQPILTGMDTVFSTNNTPLLLVGCQEERQVKIEELVWLCLERGAD